MLAALTHYPWDLNALDYDNSCPSFSAIPLTLLCALEIPMALSNPGT